MDTHQDELNKVLDNLAVLAPTEQEQPLPASLALAQLKQKVATPKPNPFLLFLKEISNMLKLKRVIAPLMAVFVIGLFVMSPTLQAAASDFLGLFRVNKFAAISISPEQIALLEEIANSGVMPGEFEMISEPGRPERVENLRQARLAVGYDVQTPSVLSTPSNIMVADGGEGRLTIDLEGSRKILELAGADPQLLPESIDGEAIEVTIYANVAQEWEDGYSLIQMESPLVKYPEDIDVQPIGKALLQVLGMDEEEADRLSSSIDWTSTLIVPIPESTVQFEEVTVNGVSGLALGSFDGKEGAIVWQKDGMLYAFAGNGNTKELVRIANSIQ